ncbi:MAG: helix-turn-helix domain-containing protein [Patescibacteria group bacterium]
MFVIKIQKIPKNTGIIKIMPADISKLFISLGLSSTETKVYLASLALGPASVQDVAKKARLSRTATYDAVASLQERGLMSTFERGKKRFFAAEDPESSIAHFKNELHRMEEHLNLLTRMIPEIKMNMGGEKPVVRFYEGKEAVYALFNDVATVSPKYLFEVANFEDIDQFIDKEVIVDAQKLYNPTKMEIRLLHHGSKDNKREGIEYCELLPELGSFHGDIWIYSDRVAFVTFVGRIMSVIIESKPFADTARVLFEAAWRICSKK